MKWIGLKKLNCRRAEICYLLSFVCLFPKLSHTRAVPLRSLRDIIFSVSNFGWLWFVSRAARECVRSFLGCLTYCWPFKKCMFEIFVRQTLPKKRKAPTDTPHIKFTYIFYVPKISAIGENMLKNMSSVTRFMYSESFEKAPNRFRNRQIYFPIQLMQPVNQTHIWKHCQKSVSFS